MFPIMAGSVVLVYNVPELPTHRSVFPLVNSEVRQVIEGKRVASMGSEKRSQSQSQEPRRESATQEPHRNSVVEVCVVPPQVASDREMDQFLKTATDAAHE